MAAEALAGVVNPPGAVSRGTVSVEFCCRLTSAARPLRHVWQHTVGSDHAPVALRADWQQQLRRCRRELGFRHVRFHGLLSDDMGTLISNQGRLLYSFFNADQVMDFSAP